MYPATSILDLKHFTSDDILAAHDKLRSDKQAFKDEYRRTMREIPNLHLLLRRFQSFYPGDESASMYIWFRLWAAIKSEEAIGVQMTISLLRKTRNLDAEGIELAPTEHEKPDCYFFEILHSLIA